MTTIPFGAWQPDLPALNHKGVLTATNVLPINKAYRPTKALTTQGTAFSSIPLGAVGLKDASGNAFVFCGITNKLYRIISTGNTDVSKVGGYSAGSEVWKFARFGNNLYATDFVDPIQTYDLTGSGTFSDLAASAPKARYLTICNEFLLAGNVNDSLDGVTKHRVWWSPIGDPAGTWSVSQATQCDYDDMPDMGAITGMIGYQNHANIFLEKGVVRLSYEGTPLIFRSDNVANVAGNEIPNSLVAYNDIIFYYGFGTFWAFNGSTSQDIGVNQIARYFSADLDQSKLNCVSSVVDEVNGLVMWLYPGSGSGECANKIIYYNIAENRWGNAEYEGSVLFAAEKLGTLLDEITGNLDDISVSLDSAAYAGGGKQIAMFSSDYKISTFSGANQIATIETGDVQFIEGALSYVEKITPLIDGAEDVEVEASGKDKASATYSYDSAVSLNNNGEAEIYKTARYQRYRFTISDLSWQNALGYQVNAVPEGEQ